MAGGTAEPSRLADEAKSGPVHSSVPRWLRVTPAQERDEGRGARGLGQPRGLANPNWPASGPRANWRYIMFGERPNCSFMTANHRNIPDSTLEAGCSSVRAPARFKYRVFHQSGIGRRKGLAAALRSFPCR